jgi:Zn-dependent M28 family amino/carboxypeptidase
MNRTGIGRATVATTGLVLCALSRAVAAPTDAQCEARSNDTRARLVECIRQKSLWNHLSVFQTIADLNPGQHGHGNRNTGTSGYKASVAYVAGLMRGAGYQITIQPYDWEKFSVEGEPVFRTPSRSYALEQDWFVARLSGGGTLTAPVQTIGARGGTDADDSSSGCSHGDFAGFVPGRIALVALGSCDLDTVVANAEAAYAAAVIIYNDWATPGEAGGKEPRDGAAFEAKLVNAADIPVVGVISHGVGADLARQVDAGDAPEVHLDIRTRHKSKIDYNVIADSRFGDANKLVVVDAHLDSIYGAGMLDNASGSTTILEIALKMAHTRTRNRLRYIWFGGEELGLLGSHYYTRNLTAKDLRRIVFDIDVDVTATPNFDILVADPAHAFNVKRFPPNVVRDSRIGNQDFAQYFRSAGIVSRNARFGNDGTDSNAFSLVGVPNSGILTQQDCCKRDWEVDLWGGYLGDYEGKVRQPFE